MGDPFQCLARARYEVSAYLSRCLFRFLILSSGTSRQRHADRCYVAVKILSTHATEVQGRLANELDILQCINTHVKVYPGRKHIATLLDNFTIRDRHGLHLCLVFEALGAFNGSVYYPGQNLPVPFVKDIARQLLVALDFLHRECQIIHTGKIVAHIISYRNSCCSKRPQTNQYSYHTSECGRSPSTVHS